MATNITIAIGNIKEAACQYEDGLIHADEFLNYLFDQLGEFLSVEPVGDKFAIHYHNLYSDKGAGI